MSGFGNRKALQKTTTMENKIEKQITKYKKLYQRAWDNLTIVLKRNNLSVLQEEVKTLEGLKNVIEALENLLVE